MEQVLCPFCCGDLIVIGSRKRKYIKSSGENCSLVIRRLCCNQCNRIHHELPDILIPYKRYDSESIEAVVTRSSALNVAADESPLARWRSWFQSHSTYFLGCLDSIAIRFLQGAKRCDPDLPLSGRNMGTGILFHAFSAHFADRPIICVRHNLQL